MRRSEVAMLFPHQVARGAARELLTTTAAVGRWGGGYRTNGGVSISPTARRGTPVVLVHGLCANKSYWSPLERSLLRAGHPVASLNYSWAGTNLEQCGLEVARKVEHIAATCGAERVHLVGHSLGGVVLKWAIHHTTLAERAERVVSLGSPHQGSPWSSISALAAVPGLGTLISEMSARHDHARTQDLPLAEHVRWTTVGGGLDVLVPSARAALRHPAGEHVTFADLGHVAMVSDPRVVDVIVTALTGGRQLASPLRVA